MNLILLTQDDFIQPGRVSLRGRRKQHVDSVHQASVGDQLRVGVLNGQIGSGWVVKLDEQELQLDVTLEQPPPQALPLTLVLALPRPKMLKRILQTISAMGVKTLYLINSYRVDKSFWGSPLLQEDKLEEQLILGLEQARDTVMPKVHLCQRFKPFVEDELPQIAAGSRALVAHPGVEQPCPGEINGKITLAIGPEGGFIPYEVDKLSECGFTPIHLGQRILRVETAVPVLLSKLSSLT